MASKLYIKKILRTAAVSLVAVVSVVQFYSLITTFIVDEDESVAVTAGLAETNDCGLQAEVPVKLVIEKIGLELPVVESRLEGGTWPVYDGVANYAVGTSLVSSDGGNVGIFGHDRKDVFSDIKTLEVSDEIVIHTPGCKAFYKVSQTSVVEPASVEVFSETNDASLTLVTCDGIFSKQRYVVRSELDRIEGLTEKD